MEIKHITRLAWEDLPGTEIPFFARGAIGRDYAAATSFGFFRINGLEEALKDYARWYSPYGPYTESRDSLNWLLDRVENGEYVLIHTDSRWMAPMDSVLHWDAGPGGNSEGCWRADPALPMLMRLKINECLEKARHSGAPECSGPERQWWGGLLDGSRRRGGKADAAELSEAVSSPRYREADKAVSLDDPDPGGLQKAGLFGSSSPPRISNKAFEAYLCGLACDCQNNRPPNLPPLDKGGTHQGCVNQKIREQYYDSDGRYPRDDSPVWSEVSYHKYDSISSNTDGFGITRKDYEQYDLVESKDNPGKPTSAPIRSDTWRLDVVKIGSNGKPEKMYDMKFGNDGIEWYREEAYKAIAKKHTDSEENLEVFIVDKRCDCKKEKEEERTQTEQKSFTDKTKDLFKKSEPPIDFPPGGTQPPTTPPVVPLPLPGMPIPI